MLQKCLLFTPMRDGVKCGEDVKITRHVFELLKAMGRTNDFLVSIGDVPACVGSIKIQAIKFVRAHYDIGLYEAKMLVEEVWSFTQDI